LAKEVDTPTPVAVNPKRFLIFIYIFFISEKAKELCADKIVDSFIRKGVAILCGNRLVKGPSFPNYQDLVEKSKKETGGFYPHVAVRTKYLETILWGKSGLNQQQRLVTIIALTNLQSR
jgi:hypothetical protein